MNKIGSPRDLQHELRTLLIYARTEAPSRARIASALYELSDRVGSGVDVRPVVGSYRNYVNSEFWTLSWMNNKHWLLEETADGSPYPKFQRALEARPEMIVHRMPLVSHLLSNIDSCVRISPDMIKREAHLLAGSRPEAVRKSLMEASINLLRLEETGAENYNRIPNPNRAEDILRKVIPKLKWKRLK